MGSKINDQNNNLMQTEESHYFKTNGHVALDEVANYSSWSWRLSIMTPGTVGRRQAPTAKLPRNNWGTICTIAYKKIRKNKAGEHGPQLFWALGDANGQI